MNVYDVKLLSIIKSITSDIAVLYRSPSQTNTVFNDFLSIFEKLLQQISDLNPDFSIILGDFNARSKSWWKSDIS